MQNHLSHRRLLRRTLLWQLLPWYGSLALSYVYPSLLATWTSYLLLLTIVPALLTYNLIRVNRLPYARVGLELFPPSYSVSKLLRDSGVLALCCEFLVIGIWPVFQSLVGNIGQTAVPPASTEFGLSLYYMQAVIDVALAPVVETLFFCGILSAYLRTLSGNIHNEGAFIAISSFLFGISHCHQGATEVTVFGLVGGGYAYFYCLRRTIWPIVIAHTLHNFGFYLMRNW